jgi:hypothetical protein
MSDIRVTSTGDIFYKIDSQVANLLMAALPTVFERVEQQQPKPTAVPPTPVFKARINPRSGAPEIVMFFGSTEEYFQGGPERTEGVFGGRARRSPPAEVVEQYRLLVEREKAQNKAAIEVQRTLRTDLQNKYR